MDDDKDTRDFIVNLLMYCVNREILIFESGRRAWTYLDAGNSIDIIVSDVDGPELDGLSFLERVKQKYPEKICIAMSSNAESQKWAERIGVDAFLLKPFKVSDLFSLVERFVLGDGR